ncbi:MAG TPA: helix-turn-helix domain-containing protein [Candidatus Blautia gallistercoris]|uniref:Helix-turn-helix domain-containing protein n=1 Tax=Candidatus Blautia gallistercoris TaxID=2838490 RepID=A0A9D1WJ20_9FIRM|nr:helix-turn-helix domain-containing protein [Candidatus Blautia gallistercoris]
MTLQQALENTLSRWKETSGLDFCLLTPDEKILYTTCDKKLPSPQKRQAFLESTALAVSNTNCHVFKICPSSKEMHLLILWGKDQQARLVGELAVCQVESLLDAYRERTDKNTFMQNLLLGNYSSVDIYNKAKRLHIAPDQRRVIFLTETRQQPDEEITATVRNIFSARTRDFITAIDDYRIIIIHELQSTESNKDMEEIAATLVDMLNTEAMTNAWVSYSNPAGALTELQNAYKEAMMALEIGKIFYAQKTTFGYNRLGIGRLIYQLPLSICEMFINEIFSEESLSSLDDETMTIIRTFFENNLNLSETSRKLYVHRNTLVYRFEKLEKKFGLDIRTFEDALTFKIAMMVVDYIKYSSQQK